MAVAVARDLHAEAELRLGRKLFAGERRRDIAAIDAALEIGKERLRQAIEKEKRRAIREVVEHAQRGHYIRARLSLTDEMVKALNALYKTGGRTARAELALAGIDLGAAPAFFAEIDPSLMPTLGKLDTHLGSISLRIDAEASQVDLAGLSLSAMTREVDRLVPGALDAASRLVSGAFDAGMGDTFEVWDQLVGGWVYSAMMDGNTCDECAVLDGYEYASWDAISEVLPNGGPNPNCFGDGRCRCMAVPSGESPPPPPPDALGILGGPGGVEVLTDAERGADALMQGLISHLERVGKGYNEAEVAAGRARWLERLGKSLPEEPIPAQVARIEKAAAYNATSELHAATVARLGGDRVLLTKAGRIDELLGAEDQVAGQRLASNGVTIIRPASLERLDAVGAITPGEGSTAIGGLEATLRHELAHSLWEELPAARLEEFRAIRPSAEVMKKELTIYAGRTEEEAFAELYTVVSDPAFDPAIWPEWVGRGRTFFDNLAELPPSVERPPVTLPSGVPPPRAGSLPAVSFSETTPETFLNALTAQKERAGFLAPYSAEDLHDYRLFLSADEKTGYGLTPDGDLFNLFNAGGVKGAGGQGVRDAVANGALTLDCYDGYLPSFYERYGFREVARMKWVDEFAPPGWDYEKYGRPDVVFMAVNAQVEQVPYVTDWDAAKAASRAAARPHSLPEELLRGIDTRTIYRDPATGAYTAEREALHERIAAEFLREGVPEADPEALFMAGGTASGKSSLSRLVSLPERAVKIDPDKIKELLPEYQQMVAAGNPNAARLVHEETSDIAKRILDSAYERRFNVVVDGTGDSEPGKFLGKIQKAAENGYRTEVKVVDIPTDQALQRAADRAARTGREVPEDVIVQIHQDVAARFVEWSNSSSVDGWQLWDNSTSAPILVAERHAGVSAVLDRPRYDAFLRKAEEGIEQDLNDAVEVAIQKLDPDLADIRTEQMQELLKEVAKQVGVEAVSRMEEQRNAAAAGSLQGAEVIDTVHEIFGRAGIKHEVSREGLESLFKDPGFGHLLKIFAGPLRGYE